jgi:hypothetical protein
MVLIDVHRRNLRKRKRERQSRKEAENLANNKTQDGIANGNVAMDHHQQEFERKPSFSDQDDILPPVSLLSHQRSFVYDDMIDLKNKPELTIYSEEGIADMDLPDNLLMMEDLVTML